MRKLFLFLLALTVFGFAQDHISYGMYEWWSDTTIVADDTVTTGWIQVEFYPYLSVMVRTTNVVDSTVYAVDYLVAYDTVGTDTVFIPCVENGTEANNLFTITDSASTWRVRSVQVGTQIQVGRFIKIRIITDETANDCGNRIHFWMRTFLWKQLEVR